MKNQLIDVITDSKVEQSTALTLQNAFLPAYDNLIQWTEKAKTLVVTDGSQTREMKMAREARLALKDIRVSANKTRLALKEDSTRYGKAVQSVYNLIERLITPAEKHLEMQEKFVELQEEKRKAELKEIRLAELMSYREFISPDHCAGLGEITEDEYLKLVEYCKQALENKLAQEAQAELDKIEKERQKAERQNKLFEAGFKFNGREFTYKTLRFGFALFEMSEENFEVVFTEAIATKEKLDLEDQQREEAKQKAKDDAAEALKPIVTEPVVTPVVNKPSWVHAPVAYLFHCFLCGAKLTQIGPDELVCEDCLTMFIPYRDHSGNQCLASQK